MTPAGLILSDRKTLEDFISARVTRNAVQYAIKSPSVRVETWHVLAITCVFGLAMAGLIVYVWLESSKLAVTVTAVAAVVAGCATGLSIVSLSLIGRLVRLELVLSDNIGTWNRGLNDRSDEKVGGPIGTSLRCAEELSSLVLAKIGRLEERERLIAEYSPHVLCSFSPSLEVVCTNSASFRLWGISAVELLQRPFQDLVVQSDWANATDAFRKAREDKSAVVVELRIKKADTESVDMRWSIEWSPTEKVFFAVAEDITESKEIERIKQELFALMSHDLRSPIVNISMMLKMLASDLYGTINDIGKQRLSDAQANTGLILNIIADVLDTHAIETQTPRLQIETTGILRVFREAENAVGVLADTKNIKLCIGGDSFDVQIDALRITRVLINLLVNAIRFSNYGGEIDMTAARDGDRFRITVSDHGIGLEPDQLSNLFARYWQAPNEQAKNGSGLGLYAAGKIVESHGGEIIAHSQPGAGCTFEISLPLQPSVLQS